MASPPRPMARQAMGRRVLGSQSAGPFISTWLRGRMRGCSRQSGTLALPAYHGTERSRANAPSVKEKETPCVAAAGRVAISVNSLSARREWAGYRGPFTAAPGMAAGRVGMPVALEPCVMMERLTPHEMRIERPQLLHATAVRWGQESDVAAQATQLQITHCHVWLMANKKKPAR